MELVKEEGPRGSEERYSNVCTELPVYKDWV